MSVKKTSRRQNKMSRGKSIIKKETQSPVVEGVLMQQSTPFDVARLSKKHAPTWGLLHEPEKVVRTMLKQYKELINLTKGSNKYTYFTRLAKPELVAHAEMMLTYILRDIENWEKTIDYIFEPAKNKTGKIWGQEELAEWLGIANAMHNLPDCIQNTMIPAFMMFDEAISCFAYETIGLSIPEYLMLKDDLKKEVAKAKFKEAVMLYNKKIRESIPPGSDVPESIFLSEEIDLILGDTYVFNQNTQPNQLA